HRPAVVLAGQVAELVVGEERLTAEVGPAAQGDRRTAAAPFVVTVAVVAALAVQPGPRQVGAARRGRAGVVAGGQAGQGPVAVVDPVAAGVADRGLPPAAVAVAAFGA